MARTCFVGKARTLDAMSNATNEKKEEKDKEKKNSKAQKDKTKEHSTNAENVEVVEGNKPGKYKVEAVKDARKKKRIWEYEIKWVGYEETTWEPWRNLDESCREYILSSL